MPMNRPGGAWRAVCALTLAVLALASARPAQAASAFPDIPVWANAGAWQDSSTVLDENGIARFRNRCIGSFQGPQEESLKVMPRALTVRFLRDRRAEARPDFGGYRIYRMTSSLDTTKAVLVRRFSLNADSTLTWRFSRLDPATMQYKCRGGVVHDSIVTFVDPDSNGLFRKVCRRPGTAEGQCLSPGDSIFILVPPPGPHDGIRTWYSVTYERKNTTDPDYEDLFLPDTLDAFARCGTPGARNTCPNLNHKLRNLAGPVEPTGGPVANLERVLVVPNPYRATEVWDQPGQNEIHFINLPSKARIRIYTVAGDLVRVLEHDDPVRDFERWDLKNETGKSVASGIYMYRVEAGAFQFQNRFVVIR
jgi:hypothetical protein